MSGPGECREVLTNDLAADVEGIVALQGAPKGVQGSLMVRAFHDTGLNEDVGVDEHGGYRPSSS